MKRNVLKALALSAILGVAAAPAYASDDADCGNTPRDQWMTMDAAKAKGVEMGYEVRKVEADDGCYELKVIDKNGARAELYLHPVTGAVVQPKDDD